MISCGCNYCIKIYIHNYPHKRALTQLNSNFTAIQWHSIQWAPQKINLVRIPCWIQVNTPFNDLLLQNDPEMSPRTYDHKPGALGSDVYRPTSIIYRFIKYVNWQITRLSRSNNSCQTATREIFEKFNPTDWNNCRNCHQTMTSDIFSPTEKA